MWEPGWSNAAGPALRRRGADGRRTGRIVDRADRQPRLLIVLKGYPRLSETFIAQELLGFQTAGLDFEIVSLRQPYDVARHPVHDQITAPVRYLPEYLYQEPLRVARGLFKRMFRPGFGRSFALFIADLWRDPTPNRVRRFGQALVLAAETPPGPAWLHAHFAHTPTSVARYAAALMRMPYTISAHAKDIWTSPDWELSEKLDDARWTVTCTRTGHEHLSNLAPGSAVHLCYHGLDLARFPPPDEDRPPRDGSAPEAPVTILSVGRAVPKKGYSTLLAALARLPSGLSWRFVHIGGGDGLDGLKSEAAGLGIADRVAWRGPQAQTAVLAAYREADIFALASQQMADGDRDGLPNVIVEAASQRLACVATRFSAIPEFVEDGTTGLLVPPEDPGALAAALETAIRDPALRSRLGRAAEDKARREFDFLPGIERLIALFRAEWEGER